LNQFYRNLALWMIIALAMVFLFNTFKTQKVEYEEIPSPNSSRRSTPGW
jgi:hypothetical protein